MKRLLLIVLFIFLLSTVAFAQIRCSLCNDHLTGAYYKNGDRVYCQKCYDRTRIKCSSCGKVVEGQFYKDGINNYCQSCAQEKLLSKCFLCYRPITGKYFNHNGQKVCENCYYKQLALRCSKCNTVIEGKYMSKDNKKYCLSCFDNYIVPHCCICDKKLPEGGLGVQGSKYVFCKSCYERYEHCKSCGIPIKNALNNEPNFPLCSDCNNANIVISNFQVREIFDKVKTTAKATINLELKFDEKRIYLVSHDELKEFTKSLEATANDPLGVCRPEYFFNLLYRQAIYIQRGMPTEMAFETLAHEYGHAWRNANGRMKVELIFEEGFCEWVSYKCLLKAGYMERAKKKLENKDPIYGLGLRKMLTLEKKLGSTDKVLNYVRNSTDF